MIMTMINRDLSFPGFFFFYGFPDLLIMKVSVFCAYVYMSMRRKNIVHVISYDQYACSSARF